MVEGGGDNGVATRAPGGDPNANAANAVFVSYASQDSAIAEALCAALERAGISCWIAPRDVRPGDFYADAIVQAINACSMLVLILSSNAIASPHVLREVERAGSKQRPIITFRIGTAALPPGLEYFLSASQWLEAGAAEPERAFPQLVEAVRRRSSNAVQMAPTSAAHPPPFAGMTPHAGNTAAVSRVNRVLAAAIVVIAVALPYVLAAWFRLSQRAAAPALQMAPATPAGASAVAPADKSVAVLPFEGLSEGKDQQYFSDGLSEELIDLLAKIPGLRVPARTSSFYFKGKQTTLGESDKELKVATA